MLCGSEGATSALWCGVSTSAASPAPEGTLLLGWKQQVLKGLCREAQGAFSALAVTNPGGSQDEAQGSSMVPGVEHCWTVCCRMLLWSVLSLAAVKDAQSFLQVLAQLWVEGGQQGGGCDLGVGLQGSIRWKGCREIRDT